VDGMWSVKLYSSLFVQCQCSVNVSVYRVFILFVSYHLSHPAATVPHVCLVG